jgi:DNA-binding response OmpR family regulator
MDSEESKQKILIIEDDGVFNNILKKHFEHKNYTVSTTDNGIEGFKMALETKPLLIILDADLPTMTGYELTRKIKGRNALKDIPIIMVSTLTQDVSMNKGINFGAVEFITKPVDIEFFTKKIESFMKE